MSRMLTAQQVTNVGEPSYFAALHQRAPFGPCMRAPEQCDYATLLRDISAKALAALDEMYEDLQRNVRVVRYFSPWDVDRMTQLIRGLSSVCDLASTSSGQASACLSILTQSDSSTRTRSGRSDMELDDAVDVLKNGDGSGLTAYERFELIRRASQWDDWGDRPEAKQFLLKLTKGYGRDFLSDVMEKHGYSQNPNDYTGRCGFGLGTDSYVRHMEQHVFATSFYGSTEYGRLLRDWLEDIARALENDLSREVSCGGFLVYESRERVKRCAAELERVGVRVSSSVEANLPKLRRLEFFDNSIIEINCTGSSYPVEAELKWENGKNILHITANIKNKMTMVNFPVFGENAPGYKAIEKRNSDINTAITKGIERWNGTYTVFNGQSVTVVCSIVESGSGQQISFVPINFSDRSAALAKGYLSPEFWGWLPKSSTGKQIFLSPGSDKDIVAHEFGHMLGLGDIYKDDYLKLPGVPHGTYGDLKSYEYISVAGNQRYDLVMDNNSGFITGNDVEMVIRAFQTGDRQNYQKHRILWGLISNNDALSDVLGR